MDNQYVLDLERHNVANYIYSGPESAEKLCKYLIYIQIYSIDSIITANLKNELSRNHAKYSLYLRYEFGIIFRRGKP